MDTVPAFYDDHFHALRSAIESGQGYKKTAVALWPSMKLESAYARLKKACHQDTEYKLDLAEVLTICRFNDRYDPLYFLCGETMHDRPKQNVPADAARSLMDQIAAQTEAQRRNMDRLEAMVRANPTILKQVA